MQTCAYKLKHKEDSACTVTRQSNFELLRIIAMILIVAHHFSYHGGFDFSSDTISVNRLWIQFIQIGGKIGVDVFILISGYFLIESKSLKTGRLIKLWGQIFFYSFVIYIIFVAAGIEPFNVISLIKILFPITFSQWWFASAYFVLYLLIPYINKLLVSFSKKQYVDFLLLLLLCWCIIPTFTGQWFQSSQLLWFIVLYAFAGYLKLFGININWSGSKFIFVSLLCICITFLSVIIFDIIGTRITVFSEHATYFYNMQRLPVFITSTLLFVGFEKLNIKGSRFINTVSSATFGVYLIHENEYVRPFLWKTIFSSESYAESNHLIPYSLFVIITVFVVCTLIELARINSIERLCIPIVNSVSKKADALLEKIKSKIYELS